MRAAFDGCCIQLLDHRFPSHPDFDPNGRGAPLRPAELDTVAGAVEQAAQDKVGRYEVPRGDIATFKKIANPLRLGMMHERRSCCGSEWPDLLTERRGPAPRSPSGSSAAGSRRSSRACPSRSQNLSSPAMRSRPTRSGCAASRPVPKRPRSTRSPTTWLLRSQELPTEAEFDSASARAAGDLPHPAAAGAQRPVGAGAGQAIRRNANGLGPAAERPAAELDRHAATLGLSDTPNGRQPPRIADPAARPARGDHRRHADGPRAGRPRICGRTTPSTRRTWTARNG